MTTQILRTLLLVREAFLILSPLQFDHKPGSKLGMGERVKGGDEEEVKGSV